MAEIDEHTLVGMLQDSIMRVAEQIRPWLSNGAPRNAVKLSNDTEQSIACIVSDQEGVIHLQFIPRRREMPDTALIIPPGDSRVIDPNG